MRLYLGELAARSVCLSTRLGFRVEGLGLRGFPNFRVEGLGFREVSQHQVLAARSVVYLGLDLGPISGNYHLQRMTAVY